VAILLRRCRYKKIDRDDLTSGSNSLPLLWSLVFSPGGKRLGTERDSRLLQLPSGPGGADTSAAGDAAGVRAPEPATAPEPARAPEPAKAPDPTMDWGLDLVSQL
jgi:hypothetical protein